MWGGVDNIYFARGKDYIAQDSSTYIFIWCLRKLLKRDTDTYSMERNHFFSFILKKQDYCVSLDNRQGYALVELLGFIAILALLFASGVSSATTLQKHLQRSRIVKSWQQALQSCLLYSTAYQETLTINIPAWLRGELRCGNAPPPQTAASWNSSRSDLRFFPSGVVSPASIQIDFTGLPPCIVKLSLRGRIRYICGE